MVTLDTARNDVVTPPLPPLPLAALLPLLLVSRVVASDFVGAVVLRAGGAGRGAERWDWCASVMMVLGARVRRAVADGPISGGGIDMGIVPTAGMGCWEPTIEAVVMYENVSPVPALVRGQLAEVWPGWLQV